MFKKLKLKTTLTVQIHYNLQHLPNFYSEEKIGQLGKKKRALVDLSSFYFIT